MSTHLCEECRAVLDPTKVLRCTKCKACRYCSRECQTRNWRLHKRVCTTDDAHRPFVPVEMAVERALTRQPKMKKAPKDARCYICLEGNDGGKLLRGCACRGDSAGFVHLECLTKLAESKDESGDVQTVFTGWTKCGNCKQTFQGALALEVRRRFWRRHRSSQDLTLLYNSTKCLATCLGTNREVDAANQLLDESSTFIWNQKEALLQMKLLRASLLSKNDHNLEALGLLQAILPEVKMDVANPLQYGLTMMETVTLLLHLNRNQEAHEMATEAVAFTKAKLGLEHRLTLKASEGYAFACAKLGRVEEAEAFFEEVLTTQTRVLGRDHPDTQYTRRNMRTCGFEQPSE